MTSDTKCLFVRAAIITSKYRVSEKKRGDAEFESFVFCVFLHDSNDSKDLV